MIPRSPRFSWSIRTKLLAGFGATIIIGLIQAAMVFTISLSPVEDAASIRRHHAASEQLQLARNDITSMLASYRGFLISGDDRLLEGYLSGIEQFPRRIARLREFTDSGDWPRWDELSALVEAWNASAVRPGLAMRRSYPDGIEHWFDSGLGQEHMAGIQRALTRHAAYLSELGSTNRQRGEADRVLLNWLLSAGGCLSALVSLLVALYLSRSISQRLRGLARHTEEVASGNFSVGQIKPSGTDEIGRLYDDVNNMVVTLHTIDSQSRAIAEGNLSNPVLSQSLPGAIGETYRAMIRKLSETARVLDDLGNGDLAISMQPLSPTDRLGQATSLLVSSLRHNRAELEKRESDRERLVEAQKFESRLNRALEMAHNEEGVISVIGKVVAHLGVEDMIEVLMAEQSESTLKQVIAVNETHAGCAVSTAGMCNAVRRGRTLTFHSSKSFDACPYLQGRGTDLSAACIPLNVMGKSVGVVHLSAPEKLTTKKEDIGSIALMSARAGERLSVVRAFAKSKAQAATDPLTGLLNRRSLIERAKAIATSGIAYAVGYGDLDHFKSLNDTHGHETGDRALRLFARILKQSLRPTDVVSRWGGEEFVVLLPATSAEQAVLVLNRTRERLADALHSANFSPAFTVSFGVASTDGAEAFDFVLGSADASLMQAKRNGRDRVLCDETESGVHQTEASPQPEIEVPEVVKKLRA